MCIHNSRSKPVCRDITCMVGSNEPIHSSRGSWGVKEPWNSDIHSSPSYYKDTKHVDEGTTFEYQPSHHHMENGNTGLDLWEKGSSNHHNAPFFGYDEDENKEVDNEIVSPDSFSINVESQDSYINHSICHNYVQTEQNSTELLKKNIKSLAKKIKHFEEKFENDFGYRPSHSEMRENKKIKKYMSELTKARKELKQTKESFKSSDSISSTCDLKNGSQTAAAITIQQVEQSLKEERAKCGRIENMSEMTLDELQEEKTSLQKCLLYYESKHGRPKTTEDRNLAKPLYDRYRKCKRSILRAKSQENENFGDLPPIIEHETMTFTQISPLAPGCIYQPTVEGEPFLNPPQLIDKEVKCASLPLGNLHSLPLRDLKTRKKDVKEEKKQLRKTICDFEEQFERENGRKFHKEDRAPLEQTYLDYKYSKAKLRLIEALLTKLQPIRC